MSTLVIVPHQDDELFCYSLLDKYVFVIIVFKGGGESKAQPSLTFEELYNKRCKESIEVLEEMGVAGYSFSEVVRPYSREVLDFQIRELFRTCNLDKYDRVITTHVADAHEDHKALGKAVLKFSNKPVYGFIVNTDALNAYSLKHPADIEVILTADQYRHKISLADKYRTQNHFLPNVIKRGIYRTEKYWRMDLCH